MTIQDLIDRIKKNHDYSKVGMILCHNGVVRSTSRDGREVTGLKIAVNHEKLQQIVGDFKKREGIVDILVHIFEDKDLAVGDDVMFLVVAGDIRDRVISALKDTLNAIKSTVTTKTEYYRN